MGEYDPARPDLSGFTSGSAHVEPPIAPRPPRSRRSPESRVIGLVVTVLVAVVAAAIVGAVVIPQVRELAQGSTLASPTPVASSRQEISDSIEAAIAEAALEKESVAYSLDCPGPIWEVTDAMNIRCIVIDPRDSRVGSTQVRIRPAAGSFVFEYSAFDFDH